MTIRLILCAAVGLMVIAGCSGTPDASGQWGGVLTYIEVDGTEQEAGLAFDLSQDSGEGSLSGTMSLEAEEEARSVPISSGEVGEDGSVQMEIESQNALDPEPVTFDGEITEDRMEGEVFGFSDESATFSVERGAEQGAAENAGDNDEGTVLSSDDEEDDFAAESTGASAEEARAAVRRYSDLDWETSGMVEDLEGRIDTLEEPEADLEEALGPGGPEPELSDCIEDPASCEAAYLEDQVEGDRETFEEEGYNEAGCEAASDPSEYAEYTSFDEAGGETYLVERNRIEDAADGLAGDASETLEQVRETEAAYDEARETAEEANSPFPGSGPSNRPSEVEPLVEEASEAQERAEEAVADANERYEEYASRADRAVEEARALYARAGCAIEET